MSEPYKGPAGVWLSSTELARIHVALLASNDPKDVAIRYKIRKYLEALADDARRDD